MHVLSGRYLETGVPRSRARDTRRLPFRVVGPSLDEAGVQYYRQEQTVDRKAWDRWFKGMEGTARKWDLVTWQFAEWGLERVTTRFQHPGATSGVRFVPARQACEVAASRMRDINLGVVTIPAGWMAVDAGRPEEES
ncbi:MAG: hypothetical protein ACE37B_19630 [Ilumatobacter sp.]|uniref:hypothetical protein n=1 Tax=Ilumatobacter sp. TaxID=1967498 RepID=UPI00391B4465